MEQIGYEYPGSGRPFYSLDLYLKKTYGEKLYKIAIDAGFTCPNRDGTLGVGGCIFCSAGGSGEHAVRASSCRSVKEQLDAGIALFGQKNIGRRYIAYFQAYTNTYAPLPRLRALYEDALREPSVAGISIATRPDCVSENTVTMLVNLLKKFPDKFVWIELGLQTIHEETASYIKRHYPLAVYDKAVSALNDAKIPYITHVILGLPNESEEMMLDTVRYVCRYAPFGIKLQLLHVLKGTKLADDHAAGYFKTLELNEYLELIIKCIQNIPKDVVIHRVTGDGPKDLLIAPTWSAHKRHVLNSLHKLMKEKNAVQGEYALS